MNNGKFAVTVSDYCTKMRMALLALSRLAEEDDGTWFVVESTIELFNKFAKDAEQFKEEQEK